MIMVQDTREQKELDFSKIEGVEKVEKMTLPYGDYTAIVHGRPVPVLFERKGLGDLFGTMTSGYDRFKAEMDRAKVSNMKLILIVEGTYGDVEAGYAHSKYPGTAMIKKLHTLRSKYDLETIFCESRRVMAKTIAGFFYSIERNWTAEQLEDAPF